MAQGQLEGGGAIATASNNTNESYNDTQAVGGGDNTVVGDVNYMIAGANEQEAEGTVQLSSAAGTATAHVDPSGEFAWPEHADVQVRGLDALRATLAAR